MESFPPLRCGKLSIGIKTGIAKLTAEREFFDGRDNWIGVFKR